MNKKFKIGDKVVCVDNTLSTGSIGNYDNETIDAINKLKIGGVYNIINTMNLNRYIKVIENLDFYFYQDRFISLKEYRKQKINKIFK